MDRGLPVPGQVGGALARPGRGIKIGRLAAHGLRGAEQFAVISLADHDVGGREIAEDVRAGQGRAGGRRRRRPEVLADFRGEAEVRQVGRLEHQIGPQRDLLAGQPQGQAGHAHARCEPAILVEFPIVRQETFGRHPEDFPAGDHHRAIVDRAHPADRRAHDQHRREVFAGLGQSGDLGLHPLEQGVLQEQVVDGIGRQPEFREQHQVAGLGVALPGQRQGLGGVETRVAHRHGGRAGGHAHETVTVNGIERSAHERSPFFRSSPHQRPICRPGEMLTLSIYTGKVEI